MTEPRRVRTQVERAADGTAWRNRYATVDDIHRAMKLLAAVPPPPAQCRMHPTAVRWMAAHASVKPRALGGPPPAFLGIPIIEDPDLPYGEWRLLDGHGQVVKRGRFDQPPGPEFGTTPRPPRRRWWHRYTRALAGRWLHVLTPGFLGELFNDIWSHTRHRLTRRNP